MKSAYILLSLLLLVSCKQEQAVGTPESTPPPKAQPALAITPVSSELISVTPESITDCNPAVATVRWNLQSKPGINEVEIWVGTGSDAKLFAAGGNHGETQTGAWTRPGEVFAVRLPGGSQELGKAIVGGPACP